LKKSTTNGYFISSCQSKTEIAKKGPSNKCPFYDGIPEYDMLNRGITDEERIKHGYWVAYQMAEALEKKG